VSETPFPVITAWSAISPFGTGRGAFAEGVREGRQTAAVLDPEQWAVPDKNGCLVPDFDVRATLGRKGTRMMNRVTALTIATVGQLLEDVKGERSRPEDTALVLGTTAGSMQSTMDLTRSSLTGAKPYHVEPAMIPYAVLNGAAGRCAIWYDLKGPNTTLAAGRPSGLAALSYSRRLLLMGRARTVLCGAAEEYSTARSWVDFHARADETGDDVLGEGCAMFMLELAPSPGTRPLASVVDVHSQVCTDGDWGAAVGRCVERVLAAGGQGPDDVWAVAPSGAVGAAGTAERARLTGMFGTDALVSPVAGLIGETHAAASTFQLAAVLSLAETDPASAGRLAVITSVDRSGTVGAALLRMAGQPGHAA
jgi:3-oxoacyl-[acyl-carrier-protein] synthase II